MYRIIPYTAGSASAVLLASKMSELSGKNIVSGRPSYDHKNILWGNSRVPLENYQPAVAIKVAKNKLKTFDKLKEANISIPEYTTSKQTAEDWVNEGITVIARQKLTASEGRGIHVCKTLPIVDAPLYVKLVKKNKEFRVHVCNGKVIDLQEKRRRKGIRNPDGTKISGTIRNIGNNWVFCRKNIVEPPQLRELGINAVKSLGLLFGAVDIVYNSKNGRIAVLEVNTAPGLCNLTSESYAKALLEL